MRFYFQKTPLQCFIHLFSGFSLKFRTQKGIAILTTACLIFQPSMPYNVSTFDEFNGAYSAQNISQKPKKDMINSVKIVPKTFMYLKVYFLILQNTRYINSYEPHKFTGIKTWSSNLKITGPLLTFFSMHVFLTDYCFRQAKL